MTTKLLCACCDGRVSEEAAACVHCGAPLRRSHTTPLGRLARLAIVALFAAQAIGVGLIIAERGGIPAGMAEISLWLAFLACIGTFMLTRDRASSPIHDATRYDVRPVPRD